MMKWERMSYGDHGWLCMSIKEDFLAAARAFGERPTAVNYALVKKFGKAFALCSASLATRGVKFSTPMAE